MDTLLYRFDEVRSFPVLESDTTARGPVTVGVDCHADDTFLRVTLKRRVDDPREIVAVIALPLIAVGGRPEEFLLDVRGDASGCRLLAEAGDARGWGFAYAFGQVGFTGWRTCSVAVQRPYAFWGERKDDDTSCIVPPVQLYRLRIEAGESCEAVDLGLGALWATGEARVVPAGIATGGDA